MSLSPILIYLIPPNILLKTFLSKAASHIAIWLLSAQDAAPSVAIGLINVLQNFVFFCCQYRLTSIEEEVR
jgi:hypothetical protein